MSTLAWGFGLPHGGGIGRCEKAGKMMLGVLGVGHLATAMLAGLVRAGVPPTDVLLAPRGQAAALSARHGFAVAVDNDDLVRRADVVLLAVRPAAVAGAIAGLPWRADQIVISACAGVPLAAMTVAPAQAMRIMPMTAAEIGASPTICFPDLPQVRSLLMALGPLIPLRNEAEFEVATVSAAAYGWAQELIRRTADWSVAQGLAPDTARQLVSGTFVAAGALMAAKPEPMGQLLQELVTPGGITERGLQVLEDHGMGAGWEAACAAVLHKLTH